MLIGRCELEQRVAFDCETFDRFDGGEAISVNHTIGVAQRDKLSYKLSRIRAAMLDGIVRDSYIRVAAIHVLLDYAGLTVGGRLAQELVCRGTILSKRAISEHA